MVDDSVAMLDAAQPPSESVVGDKKEKCDTCKFFVTQVAAWLRDPVRSQQPTDATHALCYMRTSLLLSAQIVRRTSLRNSIFASMFAAKVLQEMFCCVLARVFVPSINCQDMTDWLSALAPTVKLLFCMI